LRKLFLSLAVTTIAGQPFTDSGYALDAFEETIRTLRRGAINYGYACHMAGVSLQQCQDEVDNPTKEPRK
jgi:hypothetical protein